MGAKLFLAFQDGATSVQHFHNIGQAIAHLGAEHKSRLTKPHNNSPIVTATITIIPEPTDGEP